MPKEFTDYEGSLPESEDDFHYAGNGVLRLINFEVGHGELRTEHKRIIDSKLIDFLLAATKALGPGDWHLLCIGTASASGSFAMNDSLALMRAKSALQYTISTYMAQSEKAPHVKNCRLIGDPKSDGKNDASIDQVLRHIKNVDIDRKQPHYRAAMFILSARKEHPKGSNIYQIREIYLFNFKTMEEPLPAVLKRLKQIYDNSGTILYIARKFKAFRPLLDNFKLFMTNVDKALGPEGAIAKIMIKFMIPEESDACYEVKNSEENHALYRFNGEGHKLDIGILDLLKFVSEAVAAMKGVVEALGKAGKVPHGADKTVQFIESIMHDFHRQAVAVAREAGDSFAELVDIILTMTENGVTTKAAFAPSSKFVPFKFYDGSADHQVVELNNRSARRNVFGGLFKQVVDLEFGGGVTNNWRDFNAEVKITRIVTSLLEIETTDVGYLYMLKGDYPFDIVVGPTDIVIG